MRSAYFILTVFALLTADLAYGGRKDKKRKANSTEQVKPYTGPEVVVKNSRWVHESNRNVDNGKLIDSLKPDLWEKIVYRAMEINKSNTNYNLLSISGADGTTTTLTNIVCFAVKNHSIKAYSNTIDTTVLVVPDKVLTLITNNKDDTQVVVNNILIKEKWHFNRNVGKMLVNILWIGFNSDEEKGKEKPFFWVKYEDIVPLLMQYKIKEPRKENSLVSCYDFFEKRMFNSRIYKVENGKLTEWQY